jgi:hypothetical protein
MGSQCNKGSSALQYLRPKKSNGNSYYKYLGSCFCVRIFINEKGYVATDQMRIETSINLSALSSTSPRIVQLLLYRWRRETRVWFGKGWPLTETLFTWLGEARKIVTVARAFRIRLFELRKESSCENIDLEASRYFKF